MDKLCIICRKVKPPGDFNVEHVFPDTIGGGLKITSVCIICNGKLGNRLDTPFVNEPRISLCRQILQLRRKGSNRSIPNPFNKAKIEGDDADKFYLKYEDGQSKLIRKPAHQIIAGKDGWQITINAPPESLDTFAVKILEKYGFKQVEMRNISRKIKSITKTVSIPVNDTLIKYEGLKVAYEFTATVLPEYLNDQWSIKYASFLEKGEQEEFVLMQIENIEKHRKIWLEDYKIISGYPTYLHGLLLKSYEGLGLVCIIKFFNYFVFHLMSDKCLLDGPPVLLLNHPMTHKPVILIDSNLH